MKNVNGFAVIIRKEKEKLIYDIIVQTTTRKVNRYFYWHIFD